MRASPGLREARALSPSGEVNWRGERGRSRVEPFRRCAIGIYPRKSERANASRWVRPNTAPHTICRHERYRHTQSQ